MALVLGLAVLLFVLLVAPWLLVLAGAPLWAPLAIDVAILGCAAAIAATRWLLGRTRAKSLERVVAPKPLRDPLKPDVVAEVEEIRRELDAALGSIARSKLGGGGHAALLALPWYALVGAPASGKSTLLRTSGLAFPSSPQGSRTSEGSARTALGTRRCDVWLGNDAVLLDTAGRWAVSEDDAEWVAFLERLRKHRGARALDGVLLTLAIDDVMCASESERSALARQLRARIESVTARLGVAVPVYVMITKCDRLVGFSETFASLDKRGRARPWGFTLEREASSGTLDERVHEELDVLGRSLRARSLSTLASERRVESRALAAELPAHFEATFDPLANLLTQIFVASVYGETPTLRGVYFTSGTQEGKPMDRLLAAAVRASGIDPRALPEPSLEPRGYFVHQVLTRIVFADAETAAPSTRAKRRRAIAHASIGGASAILASLLAIAAAFSWQANRRAVDRVARSVQALPSGRSLAQPQLFAPLRDALSALRDEVAGPPLTMRWGLYGGARLGDLARRRYVTALREHVLTPLLALEATELETWGATFERELDREPAQDERARAALLLERQLRFGDPAEPGEPELDVRGRARAARSLAEGWCGALGAAPDACEAHTSLLFEVTRASDRPRVERHEPAIRLARLGLGRARADRAELDALIAAAQGRGYDLTLARIVGSSGRALTSERHVRGAFTRRGWQEVVRARIDAADGDAERAWVLGTAVVARSTAASRDALRRAYFEAYADEWRSFLSSVRVTSPADATASLALLEDMTRGTPPPLGRLLVAVDENAHLDDTRTDDAGAASPGLLASLTTHLTSVRAEAATSSPTGAPAPAPAESVLRALEPYTRFAVHAEGAAADAPLGVDVYADEIALLRDAIATYRDDATASGPVETRLVAARRRVDGLIAEQAPGTRDFFERVLRPPVEAAAVTSSRAMASSVATGFCAAIVTPFSASLAGRYPFAAQGDDAPLGEVTAFYRPGGTLWSYYDASLGSIAPRAGSRFELARRLAHDGASPYSSALPTFLQRSQAITSGLFPPGSGEPRIELDVRIHPTAGAASVRFSVGGTTIDYRNGPETWTRVVWPGDAPTAGARLEVESARGLSERITQDGEWGLFRLVEAAVQIDSRAGERTHTARWHLPGHDVDVVIDLRSLRTECALFGDDHRARALGSLRGSGVSAPRRITRVGSECAP